MRCAPGLFVTRKGPVQSLIRGSFGPWLRCAAIFGANAHTTKLVIATMAVVVWCPSGCAVSGDPDTALTFLAPIHDTEPGRTRAVWDDIIAGFRRNHPSIRVHLCLVPDPDIGAEVGTEPFRASGVSSSDTPREGEGDHWIRSEPLRCPKRFTTSWSPPDLLIVDNYANFARGGLLYQAEDIVSGSVLADVQSQFAGGATIDGRQYGLPIFASTRMLFYNKTVFARAGMVAPPRTWTELLADARKITTTGDGIAGYGMPLDPEAALDEVSVWTFGAGGRWNVGSTLTTNTPADRAGVAQLKKMIDAGVTQHHPATTGRREVLDGFIAGKIGMVEGSPPLIARLATRNPMLRYATAPSPTRTGESVGLGVIDYLVAFVNDTRKRNAISAFLDYLYAPANYVRLVKTQGVLPVTFSGRAALRDDPVTIAFSSTLADLRFYPVANPKWPVARKALGRDVADVARGAAPAEVLARVQRTVQQS